MIMHKNSGNCELSGGREAAYKTLAGPIVLKLRTEASAHGIEWHHAAGHSSGREIISFFPKNPAEEQAIDKLEELVDDNNTRVAAEKKALKAKGLPTSKAALWRHLAEHGRVDHGYGSVDYKVGKYGKFKCDYGTPDGTLYFDSPEIAGIAANKLKKDSKMNLFKLFLQSSGLSQREAAAFLNVRPDSVNSWSSGRRTAPDGVLYQLSELIDLQGRMVDAALDVIEQHPDAEEIEIGYCADDHEAQSLGLPFKSCHDAVIRRIVEALDEECREDIVLVPRGSTVSSAAAVDAHE